VICQKFFEESFRSDHLLALQRLAAYPSRAKPNQRRAVTARQACKPREIQSY